MSENKNHILFLTFIATLGGLLFGYDTAVISGTTGAINHFFIQPLYESEALSYTAITEFKIIATLCFSAVVVVFVALFYKLFDGNLIKTGILALVFIPHYAIELLLRT